MTVILLNSSSDSVPGKTLNYAFYVIRSPGESMTEILFPSRLSNVNSYHSLIICYIGRALSVHSWPKSQ